MVNHRMALCAAAIAAVVSMPALAGNLVTNGGFETNFGAGQFNQTLPGSSGGQSASAPGTTANGWTVIGTNSSFPNGYAFVFNNANSFTTTNSTVGPASQYANPGGHNSLPLWGYSGDASPEGNFFYGVNFDLPSIGAHPGNRRLDRGPNLYPHLRLRGRAAVRL